MAISRTLAASGGNTGSTTLALSAYNQASGNTIVLCCVTYYGQGQISSISDTAGNDFTTKVYTGNGYAGRYNEQIYVVKNCKGNANNVITITYASSNSYACAYYYDVAGVDTSAPLDVTIAGSSANYVYRVTSPFSTNHAAEAVIVLADDGNSDVAWTVGPLCAPTTLASDTLTEGSIPANFTQAVGTWASDGTNGAYASAGTGFNALYENGQTYTSDQFSECVMNSSSAPYQSGPAVRISSNGAAFYTCGYNGTTFYILRSGATAIVTISGVSYTPGQTVRLVASGSFILAFINGVLIAGVVDTNVTGGHPGLVSHGVGSSTDRVASTWVGGNILTVTPTLDGSGHLGNNYANVESAILSSEVTNAFVTIKEDTANTTGMVGVTLWAATTFSISGSAGVAGATVSWSGDATGSTTADGSGNYTIGNLSPGSYTITPTLTGYAFSPTSTNETITTSDITGVNFTATPVYTVTGHAGVAGASVFYSGTASGSVTADGSGNYSISGLIAGTYTVTPSLVGYIFSPTSKTATISGNYNFSNFTATAIYSISGNAGVGGTTITYAVGMVELEDGSGNVLLESADNLILEGSAGGTVTADGSGNYSIPGLANSNYTITPSKTDYTFSPTSASETVNGADITGVDFTATQSVVATPTFSPVAGTYTSAQTVTISSTTAGASIYWNTTGSPTSSDTLYTGPITVSASETIYAIAEKAGYVNSAVGLAAYVINIPSGGGGAAWLMADQSSLEDIPRRRGH